MAISLKHSDDHFFQTGDDEITLSSKLRSIHVPSGVAAQRPYGTLDFDRLIKQNPFENDIKLTQNKSPLNSPSKQNNSAGLQHDKNKDLTFGNNSTLSANNSDGLPQSPTKDAKNRKISDMAAEEDKEKNKSVDGSERYEDLENNFRTFPNGILKIGEKSRYSREFDEPKLTTSGSSKNIRAQNPREVYQQSNFSKNK